VCVLRTHPERTHTGSLCLQYQLTSALILSCDQLSDFRVILRLSRRLRSDRLTRSGSEGIQNSIFSFLNAPARERGGERERLAQYVQPKEDTCKAFKRAHACGHNCPQFMQCVRFLVAHILTHFRLQRFGQQHGYVTSVMCDHHSSLKSRGDDREHPHVRVDDSFMHRASISWT
jgi:hypothetical protein